MELPKGLKTLHTEGMAVLEAGIMTARTNDNASAALLTEADGEAIWLAPAVLLAVSCSNYTRSAGRLAPDQVEKECGSRQHPCCRAAAGSIT